MTQVFGLDLDRKNIAIAVGVLGLGVVLYVAYSFTYPKVAEVQSLDEQLTGARQNLDSQTQQKASLAEVPAKLARAQQTFTNLTALLPKEADQSILLIDLARLVKGSRVTLTQFTPGKPTITPEVAGLSNLYKSTNKVTITGDFVQILATLKDLERLEQLLKVEDLSITPGTASAQTAKTPQPLVIKSAPVPLSVTFNLAAYALPTATAAAAPPPPPAK